LYTPLVKLAKYFGSVVDPPGAPLVRLSAVNKL